MATFKGVEIASIRRPLTDLVQNEDLVVYTSGSGDLVDNGSTASQIRYTGGALEKMDFKITTGGSVDYHLESNGNFYNADGHGWAQGTFSVDHNG